MVIGADVFPGAEINFHFNLLKMQSAYCPGGADQG